MKNLNVTWKGVTPLIMHSCKCVNPLHPIAIEMKKLTSLKGKAKTEEVLRQISDLEWEAGAYWKDGLGLYIPGENVEATIQNGGKHYRKGADIEKYVTVTDLYIPFNYYENLTKEQLIADFEYRDTRIMTVQRSRIVHTRPRFDKWEINFNLRLEEDKMEVQTLMDIMEYAGQYVGLCDSRPKYGKFAVIATELD